MGTVGIGRRSSPRRSGRRTCDGIVIPSRPSVVRLRVRHAGKLGVETISERSPSPSRRRVNACGDLAELDEVRDHVRPAAAGRRPRARPARRERLRRVGGAVVAADDSLLGQELDRRQRDLGADRRESDDDGGAARAQCVPGEPDRRRQPRRPRSAWSTPPPESARISAAGSGPRRVDGVGGAAAERVLELLGAQVDRDDLTRAGQSARPRSPAVRRRRSRPRRRARRSPTRAAWCTAPKPVTHSAAEQRRLPQRQSASRSGSPRRRRRPRTRRSRRR